MPAGHGDPRVLASLGNDTSLGMTLTGSTVEIPLFPQATEKSLDLSQGHTAFY